jgi:hypothetical protein
MRLLVNGIMVKYKTAGPFTGGSAALMYSTMKTATVEPSATDDPNGTDKPSESGYTITFHTNGWTPADFTQEVQSGVKATIPTPPEARRLHLRRLVQGSD